MPPKPARRIDRNAILGYRAVFGAGFVVLGAATLWRVLATPAAAANKTLGVLLALALVGLGVTRIAQYARARRAGGR
jgi:hypothetical protein